MISRLLLFVKTSLKQSLTLVCFNPYSAKQVSHATRIDDLYYFVLEVEVGQLTSIPVQYLGNSCRKPTTFSLSLNNHGTNK